MKMDDRPVKIMAPMMAFRAFGGKFLARFNEDQSSVMKEPAKRIGIVKRLL